MTDTPSLARLLRLVWLAICVGAALLMAVMGGLAAAATAPAALADSRDAVFYGIALLSVLATAGAFALFRTMEARLLRAGSDAEAAATLRSLGIASLAMAEVPAIMAAVGTFLSGTLLTLAFGATLFAFAWLTWPSDDRVAHWLALHRRG